MVGLQARAQDEAAQRAAEQLGLSRDELQARREQQAAALAESLRQHNALEMYRQQEIAHQKALEGQASAQLGATLQQRQQLQDNFERQQALREETAKAAANFRPGAPEPIKLDTGETMGYRVQRSPHIWEQVKPLTSGKQAVLTPGQQIMLAKELSNPFVSKTSQFYPAYTNLLNRLVTDLPSKTNQAATSKGPKKGDVEAGYRFIGEDPASPDSWEQVDDE
jgi:hypothetical protein